jgi:hypothetical protein
MERPIYEAHFARREGISGAKNNLAAEWKVSAILDRGDRTGGERESVSAGEGCH